MVDDPKPRGSSSPERSGSPEGSGSPAKDQREDASLWALAGSGMELAAAVGVMVALGWWADSKWGTSPWLLVTGAVLGMIGGLYNLLKSAKRYM